MSIQKETKLNHLYKVLPEGLLASAVWLERKGYSSALRNQYVKSGWLDQPARGVFRRPGGALKWQQVVISLQSFLDVHPYVGGRTALELHGFTHYVSQEGSREVHLYSDSKLPGWLGQLDCEAKFIQHNSSRLFQNDPIHRGLTSVELNLKTEAVARADALHSSLTQHNWGHWEWPMTLSTPERAVLEMLDELPAKETFHQADMLMEGLRSLSPRRLQKLLEDCKSIKVKRLFLWFAHRHGFRFLHQLDESQIGLGAGKRMLIKGGHLDSKYLITVPEDMHGNQ
ncbi:MAG: type IV toxin-antitoxin system AbiEi family antitoxin [Rhodospirillales bacterium]|nr:type IV toxin-antitoxin system AbiEi family antitoxin [Rhodospirillales bacterium]